MGSTDFENYEIDNAVDTVNDLRTSKFIGFVEAS
jgi:hypothetical protein